MDKIVEFEWEIQLTATDLNTDMKISITVDAPQLGRTLLEKPNGEVINGVVSDVSLGTGTALKNQSVYCQTTVTDFSELNNTTKVNFTVGEHSITYSEDVAKQGGVIQYQVTIKFKS